MNDRNQNPLDDWSSDFYFSPPGSPSSFRSAKECLGSEPNPDEVTFNYVTYNIEDLKRNKPTPSKADPLSGSFDPDAARLIISPATFEDSPRDPTRHTTAGPAVVGKEPEWEWISTPDGRSGEGLGSEEWEVRDVTPRESWELRTLHPATRTRYRRRSFELDYGVGEVRCKTPEEVEDDYVVPRGIESDAVGHPRASISGRRLPLVINTGVISTTPPGSPPNVKKEWWLQ
ncbi:uncharacterized protein B0H64DRAFT_171206 [Chaetomium fimeti]|uniref:Uncharacterized protein n=1 Tax=Chaetomium fimeti TaxID=1854472 RepID=A0AAE0HHE5_9PEZI|nr:hypothetical protein B0H64DRAFT_171206 [Chaetomium fimeti]